LFSSSSVYFGNTKQEKNFKNDLAGWHNCVLLLGCCSQINWFIHSSFIHSFNCSYANNVTNLVIEKCGLGQQVTETYSIRVHKHRTVAASLKLPVQYRLLPCLCSELQTTRCRQPQLKATHRLLLKFTSVLQLAGAQRSTRPVDASNLPCHCQ